MSEHIYTRTKTYTAKVSKQVHKNLDAFLNQCTCLYNSGLQERKDAFDKNKIKITLGNQQKSLTQIRQDQTEFQQYHAHSQQSVLRRLDKAFQRFFKEKSGFPRFKSFHRGIRSFESALIKITKQGRYNVINVKGIGKLRFKGEVPDNVKMARVVKTPIRVNIQLVYQESKTTPKDNRDTLGIDVGIINNITLSSGFQLPKRQLDRTELKKKQRKISKAVKGSNSRKKKRLAYAKEWSRVTLREKNYTHRITADLIKNHSAHFVVEDLKIQNMIKNHKLVRSILESHWSDFKQKLRYKAESAGGSVVEVQPHYTSKTCSACGTINESLTLTDRTFSCKHCGHSMDRDVNAAVNIRSLGKSKHSGGKEPGADTGVLYSNSVSGCSPQNSIL